MEYQSVAIIKDENDSSQMLILNIEKLAETIVIKGNGIEVDDILIEFFHSDMYKPVVVNISTLVSGIVSI